MLLLLRLDKLLDIEGKLKQPFLQLLLLLGRIVLLLLIHGLVGLVTCPQYHLLLGEDELDVGLLDLVLGQEIDLVDEVQPHRSLEVLPLEGLFVLFLETRMQVVVLNEVVPDDEDAVVAGPAQLALLLADLGLMLAQQRQLLDDLIREGETKLPHLIVIIT